MKQQTNVYSPYEMKDHYKETVSELEKAVQRSAKIRATQLAATSGRATWKNSGAMNELVELFKSSRLHFFADQK